MSETKTPYTFNIDPGQLERLRELSEQTGVPVAWLVRDAVRVYLAQRRLVDAQVVWLAAEDGSDEN